MPTWFALVFIPPFDQIGSHDGTVKIGGVKVKIMKKSWRLKPISQYLWGSKEKLP